MVAASSVIVVNSLVARGGVGGRASVFVLERLGFPVVFAPTVLLPWHPGHGPGTRVSVAPTLIDDIASDPGGPVAGCLAGYFGEPAQVEATRALVARLRSSGARPLVLCDPVMGDSGRFYVSAPIRDRVRDLARDADILTPNRFELSFLAGVDFADLADNAALVAAARSLGRPEVVVTSAFAGPGEMANLLVTPEGSELIAHRAVPDAPHGTGDALAALYLGHRLGGVAPREALERAAGATLRLIEQAEGAPEMPLAAGQEAFLAPVPDIHIEGGDWVAGVDGCPAGWAVVLRRADSSGDPVFRVLPDFAAVLALPDVAVIAIDMPIGLPERAGPGGRGPERVLRPLLGPRQSSVFSVPSRAAVMETDYARACATALATSDPPRKVARQCFGLFPRMREIDALMVPALEGRVYEAHPELSFWRLNGARPMAIAKKVKSVGNPSGFDERAALLAAHGFGPSFLAAKLPRGVGRDDLLDAAVLSLTATRIAAGHAESFPPAPERDGRGLRMAIWA